VSDNPDLATLPEERLANLDQDEAHLQAGLDRAAEERLANLDQDEAAKCRSDAKVSRWYREE